MGSSSAQEVVRRQSAGYGVVVSLAGLAVSGQLVASHVLHIASPLCELSSFASCERVLSSSYATLLGVPVALFGALFFLFSFWLCVRCAGPSASPTRSLQDTAAFAAGLLWIAVAGVASVVYFVYAEWQIGALCPLCTVVHVLCVALLVLAIRIHRNAPLPSHFSLHPLHVAQLAWHLRSEAVVFVALLIAPIFFVALWSAPPAPKYDEHKLRTFASCLSQRGFTLYVRQGCGYCQMQKVKKEVIFFVCASYRSFLRPCLGML